jgi:hypothetical protein
MMACRGCRCEYVRPVITDEVITGLPRAEQRHTDESFGPAHGVCVDLTMRRSTPPVLWSCLLTGCTHAYGLDWSHHRLPYWAKFHLVLERISRCWDFEGISWSWNCHLFIIYGKVLLLLFSFCFHGLEKNPTFFHALCVGPSILHHSACLFLFICCLLVCMCSAHAILTIQFASRYVLQERVQNTLGESAAVRISKHI